MPLELQGENLTANRTEGMRRLLDDLEDAYGPIIRTAKQTPGCTDIMVNEDGAIWLTVGGQDRPTGEHLTEHAARRIVTLVSDIDNHPIEKAALSANLPTGERFAALLPPTVRRITFSIRLPPGRIFTVDDYVAAGAMTEAHADVLRAGVADRKNILIVGGTGAGKTTLGNALLAEAPFRSSRVFIIQDQDELRVSGPNVVRAFTGAMNARELVREALRHKPDRIVIGEIRDGETALEWIGASNTGHPGGLSTVHANSAAHGLSRISRLIGHVAANVPHGDIIEAVDMVAFIRRERDGSRRLAEIVKPTGHDGERYRTDTV
ncbi:Flp pilus assembly complex ATPase component TadA (plasmid) [Skermanella sp. TT6]|uniref:Flp pilus assembly complex ATPase component TadA n=1 Tax=Skermanella cutis TaxID=2775420 RepID=A0ABX7BI13_9PROT|nr:ATPase, T2SS/T4P/T4SS family [Skermanella sp. TT6]QQP94017.1 Flp pilus assembly complex ATPase component TadA [Skermanella sp. TT6]